MKRLTLAQVDDIVSIHNTRNSLPHQLKHCLDYYIGEATGLHTHLTYSGAVYYGKKALKSKQ